MRDFTASGFFSSQMGWKDLQYIGNVSNPGWNGCPVPTMEKLGVSPEIMDVRPTRPG
jgi:gluconate 2-dehydrogenase gamma chain